MYSKNNRKMAGKNPNKGVRKHGTEEGQQTNVELFKHIKSYKKLKIKKDSISERIKEIYNKNHWNLREQFEKLKDHYKELGIRGGIAWENDIQYLDYDRKAKGKKISLEKLIKGEYKSIGTYKKANSLETEKAYGNRIKFFTRTFEEFKKFKETDDLQWTIDQNRLLLVNVLEYHNEKEQTLSAINRDLKAIIRVYRLLLGDGIENEIKYKISALQIGITDLNNYTDDFNKILSVEEEKSFIPYEELLEICDNLEKDYNKRLNKLGSGIRKDGRKHPVELFQLHQLLLALAINVWNYPSRSENYELTILKKKEESYKKSNYIVITDKECWLVYNEIKKGHMPLKYEIKSSDISYLNERLCKLLRYSIKTYERPFLFVNSKLWERNRNEKVSHTTVSMWVRNLITEEKDGINKNIGVNVLRSAFVSYYFPRLNNRGRKILRVKMRTSTDIILRSYLKIYDSSLYGSKKDLDRGKSKGKEIVIRESREGKNKKKVNNERRIVGKMDLKEKHINKIHTLRKKIFKKWFRINEKREEFLKTQRHPETYAKRYVRELNSGKKDYERLRGQTILLYKIRKNNEGKYYSKMISK